MKSALRFLFVAAALYAPSLPARAQVLNAVVVATCGTPPQTYTAGQFQPLLVDTTGAFCINSSGGGSNQNVNLAQVGGASAANLMVAPSTAPVTATNQALVVDLRPDSPGIIAPGPTTTALSISHILNSEYPANSVTTTPKPAVVKATGTTGAVVATIAAVSSATNYLCGFDVSYIGGTAAVGPITVTGLLGGTWTYQIPVSSATAGQLFQKEFTKCLPASAVNTAIAVTTTADGTATAVDVNAHGYTE